MEIRPNSDYQILGKHLKAYSVGPPFFLTWLELVHLSLKRIAAVFVLNMLFNTFVPHFDKWGVFIMLLFKMEGVRHTVLVSGCSRVRRADGEHTAAQIRDT